MTGMLMLRINIPLEDVDSPALEPHPIMRHILDVLSRNRHSQPRHITFCPRNDVRERVIMLEFDSGADVAHATTLLRTSYHGFTTDVSTVVRAEWVVSLLRFGDSTWERCEVAPETQLPIGASTTREAFFPGRSVPPDYRNRSGPIGIHIQSFRYASTTEAERTEDNHRRRYHRPGYHRAGLVTRTLASRDLYWGDWASRGREWVEGEPIVNPEPDLRTYSNPRAPPLLSRRLSGIPAEGPVASSSRPLRERMEPIRSSLVERLNPPHYQDPIYSHRANREEDEDSLYQPEEDEMDLS